jgi:acyl-CoA thioester hydrolase
MKKSFEIEMKVRDYECDSQGVVNNANYLHYMENARHEFMCSLGMSFKESQMLKIDPIVVRANLHYKTPLTGGDIFISRLTVERKGAKMIFNQTIIRKNDNVLCCSGIIEAAILINKKPSRGDIFDEKLKDYL